MYNPRRSHSRPGRRLFAAGLACGLTALAFLCRPLGPRELPADARALTFVDRNGLPLGTILGRGDRHTIAVPLARMAPAFLAAVRATEDRRFVRHGAVDPLAALRALSVAARERRLPGGASTLAMQLARLVVPVPSGVRGKLFEIVVAQRLENGLSKAQILEAYANRAPMGSNLYGVESAARTYFGIDAAHLDLAQAALLAALPNDPVRLDPCEHLAAARTRQRFVLARLRAAGAIDAGAERAAAAEDLTVVPRAAGILAAPHALFFLASRVAAQRERVWTTLDRPLQTFVEGQLRAVVAALGRHDARDAAAVVIDNRSGDVLAYAGSPDYFAAEGGANDGVQALRQPGSTLKPFLYELALERRIVRPATILADAPVAYPLPGARIYRPTDYAQRFAGPVRLRIALADSLNVPAVRVLERTGVEAFLERLHALGFERLREPPSYYGLGLTLGGGEVSLYELARAYAILARAGAPTSLTMTLDGSVPAERARGAAGGNAAWSFVTDVLADPTARAGAFGIDSILSLPFPAAVKTGTSSDFRDTWTAGFSRDYTVAVWVGNFDGHPMRGISGVTGAAPLWNRIMLHLHERREPAAFSPPAGSQRLPLCATSGRPPDSGCSAVVYEWLDRGDRARYFAHDRLAERGSHTGVAPRIAFPHDGDRFVASTAGALQLDIAATPAARVTLNGRELRPTSGAYLVALRAGSYDVLARSHSGTATVHFAVVAAPRALGPRGFTVLPAGR